MLEHDMEQHEANSKPIAMHVCPGKLVKASADGLAEVAVRTLYTDTTGRGNQSRRACTA